MRSTSSRLGCLGAAACVALLAPACGGGSGGSGGGGSGVGSGTFSAAPSPSVGIVGVTADIALADVNKDGLDDLVTATGGLFNQLVYCLGGAGGLGAQNAIVLDGVEPRSVTVGDFDDDTLVNVAVWSEDGTIDLFESTITPSGFAPFADDPADLAGAGTAVPGCLHAGLLTADADEDLLTGAGGQLFRFDGGIGSFFGAATNLAPSDFLAESEVADFDGDGDDDLSGLPLLGAAVRTRENTGSGAFSPFVAHAMPSMISAASTVPGDFDGVGVAKDLAVGLVSGGGDGVRVALLMNGNTGSIDFDAPDIVTVTTSVAATVADIQAGDFDEDGVDDLVVGAGSAVYVLRNDGSGVFTLTDTLPVATTVDYVALGDVNGDGILDIVVRAGGSVYTFFGDEA